MKKIIFFAEDDEIDRMAIKRAMKNVGNQNVIEFQFFNDGQEILKNLEGIKESSLFPFLMFLDINMPKMNGLEVLERVRKTPRLKSIVTFIMSTSKNPKEVEFAYQNNVVGYLSKIDMGSGYELLAGLINSYTKAVLYRID